MVNVKGFYELNFWGSQGFLWEIMGGSIQNLGRNLWVWSGITCVGASASAKGWLSVGVYPL